MKILDAMPSGRGEVLEMRAGKNVVLSYASEQRATAYCIAMVLRGQGLSVFFDRDHLQPGSGYDAEIRKAIDGASLFVFLISPQSIADGRYTLTELAFAQQKWAHPAGRVLPVVVARTDMRRLPPYLGTVTALEPHGNVAAEVASHVARMIREGAMFQRLMRKASSLISMDLHLGDYLKGSVGKSLAYTNIDLDEYILQKKID